LKRFYETGDARGLDAKQVSWLRILLTSLDVAPKPADLNLPGYRLHALKANAKDIGRSGCREIGASYSLSMVMTSPISIWSITTDGPEGIKHDA
jgi:hypothetical protein